ncbi:MAG: endonuclease [Modestobacter sp.]|nr:endonuclease [Modestobacter sp.]
MPSPQVLERVAELVRVANRVAAELTRTVRHAESTQAAECDGLKTMQSWLRGHARLSPAAASRLVSNGRVLELLPAVSAGFADGVITAEQVGVVAPVASPGNSAAAAGEDVDLAEIDAALAEVAATQPHVQLGRVVHHYLACLNPDGSEPDPTEGRVLSIAKHDDGSVTGRFELDAVGGEKVQAALESIVQAARPRGDLRTRAQQLADALVQLADNALASGNLPFLRTVKPQLIVTIPLEDLVDPSTGPGAASTGFGATISAARARWAACDATVSRMVLDPDGLPLDVGRDKRVVPPHIRRAVERRDRHCVSAGCGAPTHWCDVHHPAAPRGPRRACESWGGGGPSAHQGPPRLPGRTRSRRPMAHLSPRRHRDPRRPRVAVVPANVCVASRRSWWPCRPATSRRAPRSFRAA